jgi:uncharacterized protein YggE
MKHTFAILALAAFTIAPATAQPELKGSPESLATYLAGQQAQASLMGEAEVKVPADRAVVTLRLTSEHKSLKEASQASQQLRASLTAYLAEQGIGADRVQSAKFSSTPRTGPWSDKVKSYRVESQVDVTVHDDKEFQAAAASVDKWTDVAYAGVKFEHSDKEAMKLKAIGQACDRAMARKKAYEEKLGVKLSVKRFNEAGEFRPIAVDNVLTSGLRAQAGTTHSYGKLASPAMFPASEEPTAAFGELLFKARVIIECSLEAR